MIGFFTPRFVKNGQEVLHAVRKMLAYKRDLMQPADVATVEAHIQELEAALKNRDQEKIENTSDLLSQRFDDLFPARKNAEIRENCEVFLVAFVIAIAIRTYFLQPFTIPTGSMQPTLNGIIVTQTSELPPNPLKRALDMAILGRSYFNVEIKQDDKIVSVKDISFLWFFTYVRVECQKQTFSMPGSAQTVAEEFGLWRRSSDGRFMATIDGRLVGRELKAGEVLRGYADTGDHVFVNKVAYNFRNPRRGEVFVFSTANIEKITQPGAPSQYYIKRLAGLPGDELRIDPPKLFINGGLATGFTFERVMAGTYEHPINGYRGYSNHPEHGGSFSYLTTPESTFSVPEKCYFALGDNSYNSADSRAWGTVPQDNLMGCGMFVYWPFGKHWGFIK